MMADKKAKTKKYKRIVYCERCGHPADRHGEDGCTAPTIKPGAPKCKCPRMVFPLGGYMDRVSQAATREEARAGRMPPPYEPPEKEKKGRP